MVKDTKQHITPRITKETADLLSDPIPGIKFEPDDSNIRQFCVKITGPKDSAVIPEESPYEGKEFDLELLLPDNYPMAPPKVRLTVIFFVVITQINTTE